MKLQITPVPPLPPKRKPTFGDLSLGDLFSYDCDDTIPYKVFMKTNKGQAWDFKANGSFDLDSGCLIRRATGEVHVQMID